MKEAEFSEQQACPSVVHSTSSSSSSSSSSNSSSKLSLLVPSKGCTMLLYFPEGSQQTSRFDSRDDGTDLDSGIRYLDIGFFPLIFIWIWTKK